MTPEIEPSWVQKGAEWIIGGIVGLGTTVWGFLRADISRAHKGVEDVRQEIRNLYKAAEEDRKETRNMIDVAVHRVTETMRLNQSDVLHAISDVKNSYKKQ
jgi:hypothetical protein